MMTLQQKVAMLEALPVMVEPFDAMICHRLLCVMKIGTDWHECAYYLDDLARKGIVKHIGNNGPDGHSQYRLNRKE